VCKVRSMHNRQSSQTSKHCISKLCHTPRDLPCYCRSKFTWECQWLELGSAPTDRPHRPSRLVWQSESCKVRSMHNRQSSPGNVSGLSRVQLLLTDCTEGSHKHQHRLSIQAATTGIHLVNGTCTRSHCPCCLNTPRQASRQET